MAVVMVVPRVVVVPLGNRDHKVPQDNLVSAELKDPRDPRDNVDLP